MLEYPFHLPLYVAPRRYASTSYSTGVQIANSKPEIVRLYAEAGLIKRPEGYKQVRSYGWKPYGKVYSKEGPQSQLEPR
jgi:hypothetical protein